MATKTLLLALTLALRASAKYPVAPVYIGCMDTGYLNQFDPELDAPSTAVFSTEACAVSCRDGLVLNKPGTSYLYSFYYPSVREGEGESGLCYCYDTPPFADQYIHGDSNGICDVGVAYSVYSTAATFKFAGCDANIAESSVQAGPYSVASVYDCFTQCDSYTYMAAYDDPDVPQFTCYCSDEQIPASDTFDCDLYSVFSYKRDPEPVTSGSTKRTLKEKLKRARAQKKEMPHCPSGLTACGISGTDGFECIDPQTELESCGGCVAGSFGPGKNVTSGVDCSSLPGVRLGAATCTRGACHIEACMPGYFLYEGQCIKKDIRFKRR